MELLTVLAVLTALAALLWPVLARAREQARRSVCLSNLRQLATAHRLYLQDWDEQFPHWWQHTPGQSGRWGYFRTWPELLRPYLQHEGVLYDPSFSWPGPLVARARLADYVLFTWGPGGSGTRDNPYWRWPGPRRRSSWRTAGPRPTGAEVAGWRKAAAVPGYRLRHGEGRNVCFVDGHARWMPAGEFWRADTDGRGFYWLHYNTIDR